MKFRMRAGDLRRLVSGTARTIERRDSIAILGCLKIEASLSNTVRMCGTNKDASVAIEAEAEVDLAGAVALPAGRLVRLAGALAHDTIVTVSAIDDGTTMVETDEMTLSLGGLDASAMPHCAIGASVERVFLSAGELARLMRPAFAMSAEPTRYYLNGLYLHTVDGALAASATDGHRLAHSRIRPRAMPNRPHSIIIPRGFVHWLLPIVAKLPTDHAVVIDVHKDGAIFTIGNTVATTKEVDGTFPDYERVIPGTEGKGAIVDRRRLLRALDIMRIVTGPGMEIVSLNFDGARLTVSAKDGEGGAAKTALPCAFTEPEKTVGLNQRYLGSAARAFTGDNLTLWPEEIAPIRIEDPADESFLVVLMPARI